MPGLTRQMQPVPRNSSVAAFMSPNWRWYPLAITLMDILMPLVSTSWVWAVFVAIAVFGTTNDIVYAQVGALLSIAFVASLLFSHLYGTVIDRRRGGELLRGSVWGDSLLHLLRALVSTPLGVVIVNVVNEASTSGYTMPFLKGQYDMADNLPGYRIIYMALMECAVGLGAFFMMLILLGLSYWLGDIHGLQVGYVVIALLVLPILGHGFPALRSTRFLPR